MIRTLRYTLLLLMVFASLTVSSQPLLKVQHFGAAQGLKCPGVNCLSQDSDGFVWIGSNMGLTRFDGAHFHTFVPRLGNHGAFGLQPRCLTTDTLNRLWMGTKLGIFVFDPATASFRHFEHQSLPTEGHYDAIAADSTGRYVWTRSEGRGWRIDVLTDSAVAATEAAAPAWTQTPDEHLMDNLDWRGYHRGARAWLNDREGGVWIGSFYDDLFYLPPRQYTFLTVDAADDASIPAIVRPVIQCSDGTIMVGTENRGLFRLAGNSKTLRLQPAEATVGGQPLPPNIQSLATSGDSLWIGTYGGGIFLYSLRRRRITAHRSLPTGNVVCMLLTADGHLLAGTTKGLFASEKATADFTPVRGAEDGFQHALAQTADGTLWAGALDKPLRRITLSNGVWRAETDSMKYPCVTALLPTADGGLWIGTDSKGVWLRDASGHHTPTMLTGTVLESSANSLMTDRQGRLWAGTFNGLFCYDPQRQTVSRYTQADGLPTNFMSYGSGLLCTGNAADGQLLIGTHQGLAVFDASSLTLPTSPLQPYFTAIRIGGRDTTVTDGCIRLDYDESSLGIDFATPAYACAAAVWYRYRLVGSSGDDWTVAPAGRQHIALSHLAPGRYRLELQAGMTPSRWEGPTAAIGIHVAQPWWRTPWACLFYFIIVAAVAMLVLRIRRHQRERDDLRRQIARLLEHQELMREAPQPSPYALIKDIVPTQPADDFMERVDAYLESHVADKQLGVESLAGHLKMSNSTLYRRMKATTSLSPVEYIRLYRLKKAALMLRRERLSIRQVSEQLCFSSVAYFTNSFSAQFGITPGEYQRG